MLILQHGGTMTEANSTPNSNDDDKESTIGNTGLVSLIAH